MRLFLAVLCLQVVSSASATASQVPDILPPGTAVDRANVALSSELRLSDVLMNSSLAGGGIATDDSSTKQGRTQAEETGPLEKRQPKRILGFMPNFRSVSGGVQPPAPGWKYNFKIATRQATDYSSFVFLGLTSITAEAMNMHPTLGKGAQGFYEYSWRGFLDKTDGTYLSAWLLPSLLHEDTRYYALGAGHTLSIRALYIISRQGVARTYRGRQTPNIAGLGAKVLTQIVSRSYYPPGSTDFSVLASKFGYSVMRDVAFSSIREFYPDISAHYIRKHRAKMAARQAARDSSATP